MAGMRILVLGGTRFLSAEVAVQALRAGHDVTVAARGESGQVPAGAQHVLVDRSVPGDLARLSAMSYDAVVDVARRPSWVRDAVELLGASVAHWTFVSSVSVYPDESTPGQDAGSPVREPASAEADETDAELYGALKVACEHAVLDVLADRAFVCRPGLIVGPGDPTGRFSYWVARVAAGGEILAPGTPDDLVQLVDVRDLATWLVESAEGSRTGVLDAISAPFGRGEMIEAVGHGVGMAPDPTWVPDEFLVEHGVEPWMGPGSLPLWIPGPEYAGFMTHDVTASLAAGLRLRPFEDSARDTLAWLDATPDAPRDGMTAAREEEVLTAWHTRAGALAPPER